MAERRRQGLCFNCNEKFTRGHNRFCRRLFFVDGVKIDDTAGDGAVAGADLGEQAAAVLAIRAAPGAAKAEESPSFSLAALAGVCFTDTLQISVTIGNTLFSALLDSGSSHSFISESAAHRTGLPIATRPRMMATVANGERITCSGVMRHTAFSVQGDAFSTDLFVMPRAGYDVVLGTQWLGTLGLVTWDFQRRTMSFTRQGRTICWPCTQGTTTLAVRSTTASAYLLDELLHSSNSVFTEPQGLPPQCSRDHSITL